MNYCADNLLEEKLEAEVLQEKMEEDTSVKNYHLSIVQGNELPFSEYTDETECGSPQAASRIFWARMSGAWKAEFSPADLLNYIEAY